MINKPLDNEMKENNRPIRRWAKRILLFCILFIVLFFLSFKLPIVQKWSVNKINNQLTEKLENTTSINKLEVNIFDGVNLNGFLVKKKNNKDTLVYINELSFSLRKSFISLIQNKLLINDFNISNAYINELKLKNAAHSDLSMFLNRILSGNKENNLDKGFEEEGEFDENDPFVLKINEIKLNKIHYVFHNENEKTDLSFNLNKGEIIIHDIDPNIGLYDIEKVTFENPDIYFFKEIDTIRSKTITHNDSAEKPLVGEGNEKNKTFDIFSESCFMASINELRIVEGRFYLENIDKKNKIYNIDHINLSIDSFFLNSDPEMGFVLNELKLEEKELINIHHFGIDKIHIDDRRLEINNFVFKSKTSDMEYSVSFKYKSLDELIRYSDKVFVDMSIVSSKVDMNELLLFLPSLRESPFFKTNEHALIKFDGNIKGRKNRLNFRNLNLNLDDKLSFAGEFSMKNAFNSKDNLYNITINHLMTSTSKLKSLNPKIKWPKNFQKLGGLDYKGRLDGYKDDFVGYGELKTNLGDAMIDMRFDKKESYAVAEYSGNIEIMNFDLGKWTDNSDLNKVSFTAEVEQGRGLELADAHAIMSANIGEITYKDYPYKNIRFNGELDKNKLLGSLNIDDENLTLAFDGNFEILEQKKLMDFRLIVERMNLEELNLSKENMAVSGQFDVDFFGTNVEDVLGSFTTTNLTLRKNSDVYLFDTVSIDVKALTNNRKVIDLYSDILDLNIKGLFKIKELTKTIPYLAKSNFPRYFGLFNLNDIPDIQDIHQSYSYKYNIKDTQKYLSLVGLDDVRIVNAKGKGKLSLDHSSFDFNFFLPELHYKNYKLHDIAINTKMVNNIALANIQIDSVLMPNREVDPINLNIKLKQDTLDWNFVAGHFIDSIGIIDIGGLLVPKGKGVDFSFYDNKLELFGSDWHFSEDNTGYFEKNKIDISNFILSNDISYIKIDDIRNTGVKVNMSNFELGILNKYINYSKMDFFGLSEITISHDNIFKNGNTFVYLDIEDLQINNDDYGVLSSTISIPYDEPIVGNIELVNDTLNLISDVFYDRKNDSLDVVLVGDRLRMDIFEHLIPNGISEVTGSINVDAHFFGGLSDLSLVGGGNVNSFKGKVDYLGTYYSAKNAKFSTDESYLDVTGIQLYDKNGNVANIKGGFTHDFYSKMKMNVDVSSDNFITLNTKKTDNSYYYGLAVGALDVSFKGPFDNTDIRIDMEANKGSKLSLPVHDIQSDFNESFIEFVHLEEGKEVIDTSEVSYEANGLDLELNLKLTNEATVSIIFDEKLGDIIRGVGTGEVQIYFKRNDDFYMYGDYLIEDGEYRFTAFGGIISKPFVVNKGGTINWSGDPLNANIKIAAHYNGLKAPMNIYLQEYISSFDNPELTSNARNKTEIDLTVNLVGDLLKPIVTFDIAFPNLTGELKTFAESKTSSLRKNVNIFNQQVASLIVSQRFLPNTFNGGEVFNVENLTDSGINTLSEFVTGQISDILSGFLQEAVSNSIWADIDVDFGVSKRTSALGVNRNYLPNEVELHVKNKFKFLDERLSLDFGGSYFKDDLHQNSNLLIGGFELEYYLNQKRNLKLRGYLKYDYEAISISEREGRTKLGGGVAYEYEFGKLILVTENRLENLAKETIE